MPTFIFLVVVSLAEGSSVGIARDSYLQNRLAFANAEFRCDWKESISEVFKKSVELEIAYVRAMLKKPDVRVSVQSEFDRNGGVKDNESLEDALTKSLRLQIEGGEVRGKYLFRSGPTPEIHHIDPLDPRKEAAERRKIAPCTPDGAHVIRKREDGRWECLEPYPSPTDTRPLVWLKSTVTVRSILPPVWGDSTVLSAHSHGADMFFSKKDSSFSEFRLSGDRTVFWRKDDQSNSLFYVTSSKSNFTLPDLIIAAGPLSLGQLDLSGVEKLVSRSMSLRFAPVQFEKDFGPGAIVYFDGIQKSMTGFCPTSIHYCLIAPVRTETHKEVAPIDRPLGVFRECVLSIKEIRKMSDSPVLQFPVNASLLDFDNGVSTVDGKTLQESIDGLVGGSRSGKMKFFGLIAGCLFLAILARFAIKTRNAR